MADRDQLERLKKDVSDWNRWRSTTDVLPDLRGANLRNMRLDGAHLGGALLFGADLSGASLCATDLSRANLAGVELRGAKLAKANLSRTIVTTVDLSDADLTEADLTWAMLRSTRFTNATLSGVRVGHTVFADVDLSEADLTTCVHMGPSSVDQMTIAQFKTLPIAFLRGCGLLEWQIAGAKLSDRTLTSLQITDVAYEIHDLRSTSPLVLTNLFISYSHRDSEFVDQLGRSLNDRKIRHWRDIHDSSAGPLESVVIRAMHDNPTGTAAYSQSIRSRATGWSLRHRRRVNWSRRSTAMCCALSRSTMVGKQASGPACYEIKS